MVNDCQAKIKTAYRKCWSRDPPAFDGTADKFPTVWGDESDFPCYLRGAESYYVLHKPMRQWEQDHSFPPPKHLVDYQKKLKEVEKQNKANLLRWKAEQAAQEKAEKEEQAAQEAESESEDSDADVEESLPHPEYGRVEYKTHPNIWVESESSNFHELLNSDELASLDLTKMLIPASIYVYDPDLYVS